MQYLHADRLALVLGLWALAVTGVMSTASVLTGGVTLAWAELSVVLFVFTEHGDDDDDAQ